MGATAAFLALGALGGAAVSGAFSKGSAPAPQAPKVMPTPDDAAVQQARRRALALQYGRRGRDSTILTAQEDRLGG